jgi:hypothetical protein
MLTAKQVFPWWRVSPRPRPGRGDDDRDGERRYRGHDLKPDTGQHQADLTGLGAVNVGAHDPFRF